MRYTLRLLTLDQLERAATLICALELERQAERQTSWATGRSRSACGSARAATPNRMGRRATAIRTSARAHGSIAYKNNSQKAPPLPLEECPWCGTQFTPDSRSSLAPEQRPRRTDLRHHLRQPRPATSPATTALPILAVDEPIYRRLPAS